MIKRWKPTAKSGSFAPENTLIFRTNHGVGRLSLEASRGFVTGGRCSGFFFFFFFSVLYAGLFFFALFDARTRLVFVLFVPAFCLIPA